MFLTCLVSSLAMTGPTMPGMVAKVFVIPRRIPAYLQTQKYARTAASQIHLGEKKRAGLHYCTLRGYIGGNSYDGAMSRWLMLKPEADTPPRAAEMVRKLTAKV